MEISKTNKLTEDFISEIKLKISRNQIDDIPNSNLFDYISSINDEQIERLIATACILKQTKRLQLVKFIVNRCKSISQSSQLNTEWENALTDLIFWINSQKEQENILVKNHIKTDTLEISLIVACMDREQHLIKCLNTWKDISYIKEIIVIDYSSKTPIIETPEIALLLQDKQIKIVRVDGERVFNLGKAYNLAVDFTNYDKIIKIDCDHLCLDSSWLDRLNNSLYDFHECYFIRGDWRFGKSLSGFLMCDKRDFTFYREDLSGWGFDDLDLARRMAENKPRMKEVIWSDCSIFITHLNHSDELRTQKYDKRDKSQTNYDNRLICHQPLHEINRFTYSVKWNPAYMSVTYNYSNKIDEMFCVTLQEKHERWKKISEKFPKVRKFEAIDTRENPRLCENYNLTVRPSTLSYQLYFTGAPGAVGCYLSHYLIWKQIIEEDIPYSLITEDDVDCKSVNLFLQNSLTNIDQYELIQLNKRFSYIKPEHRMMFHGTESYVLSKKGAEKLLKATHCPELLEYVFHNESSSIIEVKNKRRIKAIPRVYEPNSIIAPADKFISMCCDPKANDSIRLSFLNYPCVDINPEYAESDIDKGMGHIWKMNSQQIEHLIDSLNLSTIHY